MNCLKVVFLFSLIVKVDPEPERSSEVREWTQQVRPYDPQKNPQNFIEFKVKVAPDPQSESPVVAEKILFPS